MYGENVAIVAIVAGGVDVVIVVYTGYADPDTRARARALPPASDDVCRCRVVDTIEVDCFLGVVDDSDDVDEDVAVVWF